jgi:hypothetical protein
MKLNSFANSQRICSGGDFSKGLLGNSQIRHDIRSVSRRVLKEDKSFESPWP